MAVYEQDNGVMFCGGTTLPEQVQNQIDKQLDPTTLVHKSDKNVANGVAGLDSNAKVELAQMPYTAGAGIVISGGVVSNSAPNVQADWGASSGQAQILNKPVFSSGLTETSGVVSLAAATTSSIGGVIPDGSTIVVSDGVISATNSGGSGGAPTLTWHTNNTGSSITISDTSSATLVKVYKNGLLLEPTADYSVSGTTLTLTTALIATDKITTEVF